MPKISIIAAVDQNGLIGVDNHLPWKIKEDLHHFRETTMGHPVVMGKNTWLSLGKPLDGRTNIILTHDVSLNVSGCQIFNSIEELMKYYSGVELFIIGGTSIFSQFLPLASEMYLTRIEHIFSGDKYFPQLNWNDWEIVSYEQTDTDSGIKISFERWIRSSKTILQ